MRPAEALEISGYLSAYTVAQLSPIVELGSSTAEFRQVVKPHIENDLHRPLRTRGVKIITTDIKAGDGIDISGDIYDVEVRETLKSLHPRALLCCNIFEHLQDRQSFARLCANLLEPEGVLVVSVPFDYPHHGDPIDTMYRPSPEEVAELFPEFVVRSATVVADGSYGQDLGEMSYGQIAANMVGGALKLAKLIVKRRLDEFSSQRFFWLFKPYKVTIVVLQKQAAQQFFDI